jgi:ubiquinone/menaquinone biosynthesis C-methylase UbiE
MSGDFIGLKQRVRDHWGFEACGSRYGMESPDRQRFFDEIDRARYEQEPTLIDFAQFEQARGGKVLEVGLGTGADFSRWALAGATAFGRDLTQVSVNLVRERLNLAGLDADVALGDAEDLSEFPDDYFDIYYSWGVLHHTPSPQKAFAEAHRVLKPGGQLKVMLYHYPSVSAILVWIIHGPLRLNFQGPRRCVAEHVESPGTNMYTTKEIHTLLGNLFTNHPINIQTYLGSGDLLTHKFSGKYSGIKWQIVKALYPRWFVRRFVGDRFGTGMMISTIK